MNQCNKASDFETRLIVFVFLVVVQGREQLYYLLDYWLSISDIPNNPMHAIKFVTNS